MKRATIIILAIIAIAYGFIRDIDAELDRQEAACKVPAVVVRRGK